MATRYWVGGSGNWDASTTTNWSTTSGGAAGASAPTSTDDVVFDTGSGGSATNFYFPSVLAGAACQNMSVSRVSSTLGVSFSAPTSGVTSLTISGNLSVLTATCFFPATASGRTLNLKFTSTTSGKTISIFTGTTLCSMEFDGVGGVWSLSTAATTSTTDSVTLTRGELNLNSQTLLTNVFNSTNTNVRILTFGTSGRIHLSGTSKVFNCTTPTNLTVNVGTSSAIQFNTPGSGSFYGGGKTWPALAIAAITLSIYGSNSFGSTYSEFNPGSTLNFEENKTQTFTTELRMQGTVGSNIVLQSLSSGTQATISQAAGLTFTGTYLNIKDSNATGGQSWVATNSIDSGNNTGWAFPVASRGSMMLFC